MPRPFYPRGKSLGAHWVGDSVGSRAGEEEKILPLTGIETPDIQPVAIPTELSRLFFSGPIFI
jgi:hypothetical protein